MPGLFDRLQTEIKAQEKADGMSMSDVLSLPDETRKVVNWMMRRGEVSLSEVIEHCPEMDAASVKFMLKSLVESSFVREIPVKPEPRYRVRFGRSRTQNLPVSLWSCLEEKTR